jgi:murein DD-endopeptidase MepM/ murein hydrolase activator NlpD
VATVTVDLPVRNNLEPSVAIPEDVVVAAGQRVEAVRLNPVNPTLPTDAKASTQAYLGSLQTVPDEAFRYAMPFGGERPRLLFQGINGGITHFGTQRFAFDFNMPIGTPVLAAREGVVVRVVDGFPEGAFDKTLRDKANGVVIAHADSTMAFYGHLSPGVLVSVGQRVVQGQRLGLSGNSGYSTGPHLHFHVGKISGEIEGATIPIRFDDGTPQGFVPEQGHVYGPGNERRGEVPLPQS